MKQTSDLIEGPEAFKRFDDLMSAVVKVPHAWGMKGNPLRQGGLRANKKPVVDGLPRFG